MTTLFIIWQDPESRRWVPVGKLTRDGNLYRFVYTQGALRFSTFIPFGRMTDLYREYVSNDLFPLFANRLLSRSRPEYSNYLKWLGAEANSDDPLALLALTGGQRATDSLMIYVRPEPTPQGNYEVSFLSHGISHLPESATEKIQALKYGDKLYAMFDVMNRFDKCAVALRTDDPPMMVGYCPRYIARDIRHVIENGPPDRALIIVQQANPDAPLQFKLLCKMAAPWPDGFEPCRDDEFQPAN